MDWSPRGNQLLYARDTIGDVRGSLWVVHTRGSNPHQLLVAGIGCGGRFDERGGIGCNASRWSPDGTKLVFARAQNIFPAAADGAGLTEVTRDGDDDANWGRPSGSSRAPVPCPAT